MLNQKILQLAPEEQIYHPNLSFSARANVRDAQIYERAGANFEEFWAEEAQKLHWFRPWDKVLEWQSPFAQWFVGGKINACYNCIDRHLEGWRRNKAAIIFEGEPGDQLVLTYRICTGK
ncbi:hypothetical protein N752_20845 [Desulforamulus aquiferis]|nr:hypothetical protein N752_20845 [Desulforamulus aquiferis]